jgi:hypothetical protein
MKTLYPLIIALLFLLMISIPACKKSGIHKQCPLQTYNLECRISTYDAVFGGYDRGIQYMTIQTHCPEDAQKLADDMSYNFGNTYKSCHIIP